MNRIFFDGTISKDPELSATRAGVSVLNLSVANVRRWKDKDGMSHEDTNWFPVEAYGPLAELIAKKARKGSFLVIEGFIKMVSWKAPDNSMRQKVVVEAKEILAA